jgi:hypothetical protein
MKRKSLAMLLAPCLCHATPSSEAPDGRINYPSNFQVEEGANLFLFGDYLNWIAHEDGLYYAQTGSGFGTVGVPPTGSIDFDGHLKKVETKWGNGLRVGLGHTCPKEGFEFALYWTWVANEASSSVKSSSGRILPLWATPDISSPLLATFAKGHWNFDYNVLDLEWGRSSWFGGHFSLCPFFGLRGLWIDQDLTNHYDYATSPAVFGKLHAESDFKGIGLRTGADLRFALPRCFSIYGTASGSLLFGKFHAGMQVHENQFTIAKTKDEFWKGIGSLQLALGLAWDTHFANDRLHLEFHLGWEQNAWFGANQMNRYIGQLHNGDFLKENSALTLQGLVAGGRFDF